MSTKKVEVAAAAIIFIPDGMASLKNSLDQFDLRLLEHLQADARTSVDELADLVGLSPPACYRRIRRLRETGAIEREVAVVRSRTMGWGLTMMVLVILEREGSRTVADLLAELSGHPQVIDCANVTGDFDFVVRLVARDMEDYGDLVDRLFAADDRVRTFKTLVVIRETRGSKPLPAAS